MIKKTFVMLTVLMLVGILPVFAQTTPTSGSLKTINCASLLDKVRVTVVLDVTPSISVFTLSDPERIVVDFINTRLTGDMRDIPVNLMPVQTVRASQWQESPPISRVTIDIENRAEYTVTKETGMVFIDIDTKRLRMPEPPMSEPEKTISLYVKDADIVDILRMIGAQFNLNIIVTPDVKALITVRFSDVPLMSAIDALVKAAACNYIAYESGVILVKPKGRDVPGELDTRIFELDYAEATDVKEAIKRVISDKGNSEVIYRRVGTGGGSSRNSALLVTDYPEYLTKIAAVIAQLDQPVEQIAIEAKFVETTLSAQDMYGVSWSLRTAVTPVVPKVGEMAFPIRLDELVLGKMSFDQLSAALEIMQTRGKSKLIANPRTLTLDNQTAEVNMGVSVPLRSVRVDPQTQERVYTWTEKFIPVGLKVTPHITSDGLINMEIEPKVEAITGWQGSADDMRPITVRREAKTQVIVKDGEVVVIGGLVKDEETKTRSKIPILGDIPILGHFLFSQTSTTHEKSELVIFIIPHVIKP
jgi:type II secretory pathway component GspD/PulD (secretin)